MFILSQIISAVAYVVLGFSYLQTNRTSQLYMAITTNFLLGIASLILGGFAGAYMCLIGIIRDITNKIIYSKRPQNQKLKIFNSDYYLLGLWITLFSVGMYFTFDGVFSLFSAIGTILFTISIWQKNQMVYRVLGLLSVISWAVYMFYIMNIIGAVSEIVLGGFIVVGIIRLLNQKLKKNSIKE
jgi:hypothetical protein